MHTRTPRKFSIPEKRVPKIDHVIMSNAGGNAGKMEICRICNHEGSCNSGFCNKNLFLRVTGRKSGDPYHDTATVEFAMSREEMLELFEAFLEITEEQESTKLGAQND